ncbi:unnamed protein product [Linum trigynum]|uniref:Uncharacterized protein n=1 Tax=Linum trigynum TaxID=586398 RepID=A0AAV2E0Z0_9ROSI
MYCSFLSILSSPFFSPAAAFGAFNIQRVDKRISNKEIDADRRGQKLGKRIKEDQGSIYGRSKSRAGLPLTAAINCKRRHASFILCLIKYVQLQPKPPDQPPSNELGGGRGTLETPDRKRVKEKWGEGIHKGHK